MIPTKTSFQARSWGGGSSLKTVSVLTDHFGEKLIHKKRGKEKTFFTLNFYSVLKTPGCTEHHDLIKLNPKTFKITDQPQKIIINFSTFGFSVGFTLYIQHIYLTILGEIFSEKIDK